ncbi:PQQ-binding-like beta-propeller repeat protein [Actinoplanes sp. NPDC023936]|uniref:outer membrane protein assembly factor BamB family protein n=1 Tax=Actinoplanes sp. NPDC023936 TaxID=3154910 RepID=UPI00340F3198
MLTSWILALSLAATPWNHPGYDAGDSHYNPAESVINEGSVRNLAATWSVRLRDIEESCSGFSAPLLTGGRVIVTDKRGISSYDATNGRPAWRFDWDFPDDNGTPVLAVSDRLLIAANGDCNSMSDPDGQLTAIDPATGATRWKLETDIPIHSVVVDNGVIVISGWSPSDEDVVIAHRASDGTELWREPGWSSAGVALNGAVLMRKTDGSGQPDGGTSAIGVTRGELRWSRLENWTAQAAFGNRFYVTDRRGDLLAVDGTDGAVTWTAAGKASTLVATDGRRVYRSSGRHVEALDARNGRVRWATPLGVEARQPVRAGGLLYAGGTVLTASRGIAAGPMFGGHVIVAGGALYRVDRGTLTAYAPRP